MRRPIFALSAAFAAFAVWALVSRAQQAPDDSSLPTNGAQATRGAGRNRATTAADVPLDPMSASRGARSLLRNGKDYLGYREYDRALDYFREAEKRQFELSSFEKKELQDCIQRAKRGLRGLEDEPTTTARVARGRSNGNLAQRSSRRPGGVALANDGIPKLDPIQLASADVPTIEPGTTTASTPSNSARGQMTASPAARAPVVIPAPSELPPLPPDNITLGSTPDRTREQPMPASSRLAPPVGSTVAVSAPAALPAASAPATVNEIPPLVESTPAPVTTPEAVKTAVTASQIVPPSATRPEVVNGPALAQAAPQPEPLVQQVESPPQVQPTVGSTVQALPTTPEHQPAPAAELVLEPDTKTPAQPSLEPEHPNLVQGPASSTAPPIDLPPIDSSETLNRAPSATMVAEPAPAQESAPTLSPAQEPHAVADEPAPAPGSVPPLKETEANPVAAETVAREEPAVGVSDPVLSGDAPAPVLPSSETSEPALPATVLDPTSQPAPAADNGPKPADLDVNDLPPLPSAATAVPRATVAPERTRKPVSAVSPARPSVADTERVSQLPENLRREVEEIAQRQEEEARRDAANRPQDDAPGGPPIGDADISGGRLELPRAPSPTEARPIRAIPIPEEFVPMVPRNWSPSRKTWAAAATCHMPLYFQDAVLERYGQSAEQALGPVGRFFSYPLDDPRQSNQRNQILQPFYSIGLFGLQVGLLPYNLFVDPPWEAEYDLGYYRPGDKIPTDSTYLPLHGVGPPLRGRQY